MKTRVISQRGAHGKQLATQAKIDGLFVMIGRPTRWGNPFIIGRDGSRDQVVAAYREWIQAQPHLLAEIPSLRGKVLACWCKPLACHGDVLAELADTWV